MNSAFRRYLEKLALKAALGLSGLQATLVSYVLDYIAGKGKKVVIFIWDYFRVKDNKKVGENNAEKVEQALQDGVTNEDIEDATTDLLNGKR